MEIRPLPGTSVHNLQYEPWRDVSSMRELTESLLISRGAPQLVAISRNCTTEPHSATSQCNSTSLAPLCDLHLRTRTPSPERHLHGWVADTRA